MCAVGRGVTRWLLLFLLYDFFTPQRLLVPVLPSCQSPIRMWLVHYLHSTFTSSLGHLRATVNSSQAMSN